jgi:hypothetical protein
MYSTNFYVTIRDDENNVALLRIHRYLPTPPVPQVTYLIRYNTCHSGAKADAVYYDLEKNQYDVRENVFKTFSLERSKEFYCNCGWTVEYEANDGE